MQNLGRNLWLDGAFRNDSTLIAANDRGFLLGDGVFDTALVLGGRVFRQDAHLARMEQALAVMEIEVDPALLAQGMQAVAERQSEGSLRLTVTRGPGPRGLALPEEPRPTVLCTGAPPAPAAMFAPLRCAVSEVRRNETSPLSRIKSLAYLDAVLANRRAARDGASEALFLNTRGQLACSSTANLFVMEGFDLATPPLKDGVLPGIMRGWVLEHAEDFGLRPVERSIAPKSLKSADAAFLTSSLRLVAPMTTTGPAASADVPEAVIALMEGLCEAIAAECGRDPRALGAVLPGR